MLLDTPICDFGWRAPDFTLSDFDGNSHNLKDSFGTHGLLIAFICNHCPYVQAIGDRLSSDALELQKLGVRVVSIMSNDYEEHPSDSPARMRDFSAKHSFPFPYLVDEDQSVGRSYGAICTPDFFGFNSSGELQYRGRLDNTGKEGGEDRIPELLNAMRLIADTGTGPPEQYPSIGCSIKWRV